MKGNSCETKWGDIKDWSVWHHLWERNRRGEFSENGIADFGMAQSILHYALNRVIRKDGKQPINKRIAKEEFIKTVRFYIQTSKWMDISVEENWFQHMIGLKAYKVMIHSLRGLGYWKDPVPAERDLNLIILQELADFFSEHREGIFLPYKESYREEPYRTDLDIFLIALWYGLKGEKASVISPVPDFSFARPTLRSKKKEIMKGMINAHRQHYLWREPGSVVAPLVIERICEQFLAPADPNIHPTKDEVLDEYKESFPELKCEKDEVKNWLQQELRKFGSRGLQLTILLAGQGRVIDKDYAYFLDKILARDTIV